MLVKRFIFGMAILKLRNSIITIQLYVRFFAYTWNKIDEKEAGSGKYLKNKNA